MEDQFAALVEHGVAASHAMDLQAAAACYEAALRLRPDNAPVQAGLGLVRLAQGRYAEAWPLYEARTRFQPDLIGRSGIAEWRGEPLAGKSLMVWPEQGLGDEIQLARYVPALVAQAGEVVLVCSPPLARLFSQLGAKVAPLEERTVLPRTDLYIRNFSLPLRFGTTLETIPSAPYLRAPDLPASGAPRTGAVGYVWRGGAAHPNDAGRSLPTPELLAPLAEVADLVDLQQPQGDFLDTAARLQALDLVVTVDTAMAHLAGALGVPCWVMLPAVRVDWRWMTGRDDSPWYPSLRLWRQAEAGDWAGVVARMREALAARRFQGERGKWCRLGDSNT